MCGRLVAAPSMISGFFAFRISSAARSRAAGCATGMSTGCGGMSGTGPVSSPATSSGSSRCTGPGRSSIATRNASRTIAGIDGALTIWRVAGGHDRLLAGDQDHRHGAEVRVGSAGGEVERAGTERGDAHAGFAGEPAVGRGHEGGGLLVAGDDELDRGGTQRLDHVEVLLTR